MTPAEKYLQAGKIVQSPPTFRVTEHENGLQLPVATAIVTMSGGVSVVGEIPAASVPGFLGWLKENFIDPVAEDARFDEAPTRKLVTDE